MSSTNTLVKVVVSTPDQLDALVLLQSQAALAGFGNSSYKALCAALPAPLQADFKGDANDVLVHYPANTESTKAPRVVIAGLGKSANITAETVRTAAHLATRKLSDLKVADAVFVLPNLTSISPADTADAIVTGFVLSNYKFDKHIGNTSNVGSGKKQTRVSTITIVLDKVSDEDATAIRAAVVRAGVVADSVNFTRDLCNERPATGNPAYYETVANAIAQSNDDIEVKTLQFDQLVKEGLNLIAAVGQSAKSKSRLVILTYKGDPDSTVSTALVGKGVTFDTGGVNIKTAWDSIKNMYLDMCGTGAVLGTFKAIASLKPKANVIGVCCLADNAVDGESFYPSDILKSYNGLTVEIDHTDAEGRLVMADGIAYVQRNYKVDTVIDLATLTGAAIAALGETTACLFSNDDDLAARLASSGTSVGERYWRMPITDEHRDYMKGDAADLTNLSKSRSNGGACSAAAFLERFIEGKTKWAHLDIAGPAGYSKSRDYIPKGATGFGVRTLVDFVSK